MREYNIEKNRLRLESELKEEFYAYKRQILASIEKIKAFRWKNPPMDKVLRQFFVDIKYTGEFNLIEVTERGIKRRLNGEERASIYEIILGEEPFEAKIDLMEAVFYRLCTLYQIDLS